MPIDHHNRRRIEWIGIVLVLGLTSIPDRALAFASAPFIEGHDVITIAAAEAEGFDPDTAKALVAYVYFPDWTETTRKLRPNENYVPSHHFDRNPGISDANAFFSGSHYLRDQIDLVVDRANAQEFFEAHKALGRALHVIQDFFSHSNYIDMTAADQLKCREAFYDPKKLPPATLSLTGFDGDLDANRNPDPESPAADPYPHKTKAKDWATKNAESKAMIGGQTKFALARDAAIAASRDVMQRIEAQLGEDMWGLLRGNFILLGPYEEGYPWFCSQDCSAGGCSFGCFNASLGGYDLQLSVPSGALPGGTTPVALLGLPGNHMLTKDMVRTPDGISLMPWWEIRMGTLLPGTTLGSPAQAVASIPDSVMPSTTDPDLLGVYFFDPVAQEWVEVAGSIVNLSSRQATFAVSAPGFYALGDFQPAGTAVPAMPRRLSVVAIMTLGAAGAIALLYRRRSRV